LGRAGRSSLPTTRINKPSTKTKKGPTTLHQAIIMAEEMVDDDNSSNNNNNASHRINSMMMMTTETASTLSTASIYPDQSSSSSLLILPPRIEPEESNSNNHSITTRPPPPAAAAAVHHQQDDQHDQQQRQQQLPLTRNHHPIRKIATSNNTTTRLSVLKDPLLQHDNHEPTSPHDHSHHDQHHHQQHDPSTKVYTTMRDNDQDDDYQDELYRFRNRTALWLRSPPTALTIYLLLFTIMAGGMVYGVSRALWLEYDFDNEANIDWEVSYNVAFLGNSYFFVNDIPRAVEAMSAGHIYQNSCIHPGSSLAELWVTGNGMYQLWTTPEAALADYNTYDYGLCSVAHILQGYDEYISYGNTAAKYYDDGLNPCINNQVYDTFIRGGSDGDDDDNNVPKVTTTPSWDYVVLVDQTKRMAIAQARNETVQVLQNGYAKFLTSSSTTTDGTTAAAPPPTVILVDTHAFWSDSTNMTGLDSDIVSLTRLIYQGVQSYASALSQVLSRPPIIAPIGLCFLVIYEEDEELWERLFLDDQIHMSLTGSYLFTMVLYTTIFGHLPPSDLYIPGVFADARKIIGGGNNGGNGGGGGRNNNNNNQYYEDMAELDPYFRQVVRKVVLKRYIPTSLNQR
jgi:hypothetical protein